MAQWKPLHITGLVGMGLVGVCIGYAYTLGQHKVSNKNPKGERAMPKVAGTHPSTESPTPRAWSPYLIQRYELFVFDLDGVIYAGNCLCHGI